MSARFLDYVVINDGTVERVTSIDIDPAEMAGVLDRAIYPIELGVTGWALNRHSGYTVSGEIGAKRALIDLYDEGVPMATIGICIHSRAAKPLWSYMRSGIPEDDIPDAVRPDGPWAALRYYCPEIALPTWMHPWGQTLAWALLTR